jgi:hypothetical protein
MRRFSGIAAGLFLCVGACGKTQTFIDAGGDDDVTVDAITTGSVTVTTHSRCCTVPSGTLVAGIEVVVVQADGSAGDSGQTDANGTIVLEDVQTGAAITAIYPNEGSFELVTIVGVTAGDSLVFGDNYTQSIAVAGVDGQMTATWPQVAGTARYDVVHPCGTSYNYGETTLTGILYQYYYCQSPTGTLRFIAYDQSYNIGQTGLLEGAPYTNGLTATLPAWTAPTAFQATLTGAPAFVEQVQLQTRSVVDGTYPLTAYNYVAPTGGVATLTLTTPSDGDRIAGVARLTRAGDLGSQEVYTTFAGNAASGAFTAPDMPWVGDTIVSASGSLATWVQVGDTGYDAAVAFVSWQRFIPDGGEGGSYINYDWTIVLPPGVTEWSWSERPAALADYLPEIGDSLNSDVELVDLSTVDGYDALRATPEWQYTCPFCESDLGALTGTANVAYSYDGGEGFAAPAPASASRAPWRRASH